MNWPALQAHLEQIGRADTDGVRRAARYTRCACGRPVLVGLDSDVAGLPVTADVADLDRPAELAALLDERTTFTVLELPGRLVLAPRHVEVIRAPRQLRPVVAAHRCHTPDPSSTAFRWRIPPALSTDVAPPF